MLPDKKSLMQLMRLENTRILDMLHTYNVPDSIEDSYDEYLLHNSKTVPGGGIASKGQAKNAADIDELEDRLNTIKNKMKSKKRPMSERAVKKHEAKKLKKNKEFKKVLISAAKSLKNENQKKNGKYNVVKDETGEDSKAEIKPVMAKPVYNEEGKMVFSKFDFAAHPGAKAKKSHKNPKEILKQLKAEDKRIAELKESGQEERAAEVKNDLVWRKAFDKIEGKKVKDDPKLLYKAIKKRKVEKKKSKKDWVDRKKKVDMDIEHRQKKREENINKRIKDKKNKKLKRLSKKGKVVPGF